MLVRNEAGLIPELLELWVVSKSTLNGKLHNRIAVSWKTEAGRWDKVSIPTPSIFPVCYASLLLWPLFPQAEDDPVHKLSL